ncbi:MAG: hypothetical protein AAF589_02300, partial [Planctomycetota bacterium]
MDYTPVFLTGLTVAALLGAAVVVRVEQPQTATVTTKLLAPDAPAIRRPWPTDRIKATNPQPKSPASAALIPAVERPPFSEATIPETQIIADADQLLRESLYGADPLVGKFVRRFPVGPVASAPLAAVGAPRWLPGANRADAPGELLVLLPGEPRWSAGAPATALSRGDVRFLGRDSVRAAYQLGRWWGGVRPPELKLPIRFVWKKPTPSVGPAATAQAAIRGPVLIGPGDRLAMAPRRPSQTGPRLDVIRRESPRVATARPAKPARKRPEALLRMIDELEQSPETEFWAQRARTAIEKACDHPGGTLDVGFALRDLSRQGLELADLLDDEQLAVTLRRACYAIDRRAAAWRIVSELQLRESTVLATLPDADQRLRDRLAEVVAATAGSQADGEPGDAWRRYLMTDKLDGALATGSSSAARAELVADVLRRISPSRLSDRQHRFVATGPIAALGDELKLWGGPPTDTAKLLTSLEDYESVRSPRLAQQIAVDARRLRGSPTALHRQLAEEIEQKYRNANLRVAVSDGMLERFLPSPAPRVSPVRDHIAGALVRGRSMTQTQLSVRLLPDPFRWRIGLEARGQTASSTYSNPGPVVLRNRSQASFHARKLITVQPEGVLAAPAVCEVNNRTRLVGLSSYYDNVPLLGSVIRSQARDEYEQRRGLARRQSSDRIRQRVRQTLDREAAPMLAKLEGDFATRVVDRATALGMQIKPLEVRTTESRLIARLRVANDGQLAAHTPRNRAPSDSFASLQLHESLFNNAVDGLAITGRSWAPRELVRHVRTRLQLPERKAVAGQQADGVGQPVDLVFA